MFLNELLVWFIILAPFFCLLLSAFVAVATYRAVVSWRDAEALREAAQPNSVPRNPAGRARRRTVRNGVAGGEDQEVGLNAAVLRARQKAPSRGISRSLADAMVQTSFMLFRRPSDRSIDEAGPSRPSTHIVPPSSSNLPGPSARRQATPGPSGSRLDAPGSSAARRHAPRPPTPGPSAPRAVVCDAFTSPVGIPTTPGSSSRHVSGRGELSMSSPIKRRVRKFTPRAKTKPEHDHLPAEPSQVVISFYQPEDLGDEPIDAPPDLTHDPELSLGDLFYYMMRDGTYQLWLWSVGRDGQPWWKPVYVGYQREDGKWLLVTPHYKVPGWVTWDRFSRVFDLSPSSRG